MTERKIIYKQRDEAGKIYYSWGCDNTGGYPDLTGMIALKGLKLEEIKVIPGKSIHKCPSYQGHNPYCKNCDSREGYYKTCRESIERAEKQKTCEHEWETEQDGWVSCKDCWISHPDCKEVPGDTECLEDRGYRREG